MKLIHSAFLLVFLQFGSLEGRKGWRSGRGNPQPRRAQQSPPTRDRAEAGVEESFSLDFTAVGEGNMDDFMAQIKNLAQSLYPCSSPNIKHEMRLHSLENTSVVCNDGTPAGFIPYCSSDVWSGASTKSDKSDYAFMGSLIIKEVVKELLTKGLDNAKVLLLAGSSAGGTGVLLNVDRVAEQLQEMGHKGIQVRGLSDSGWFLDNKQYRRTDCVDTINCAPTEAIKIGIKYWNGVVPERCKQQFREGEEWNCFFGYKVYPALRSPVFVVQWLFDEAQLTLDNIHLTGQPVQEGQWLYIQNLGRELRNTLKDVPAMFAPACLSHEAITRSYWMDIQVKGTSLPRALHCWDRSLHDNNKNNKNPPKGCPVHLIDSCPWPHCNPTCPTIRDQFTGQEMNVIQFLMHMGFDVQKMAQQQGMEPNKLLGMLSSGS
ncbi:Palmitoleoyl-protein carboxylesterase notum1a [Acipenser ruthenus]|uniref:Palmitoleoyl-protein carboxylesterase notum1a n=1 Tax=Acipenser ruthenus TaxID=7906 RepID=A0A444UQE6_ACIRT|nr:Palmitoleoyl-protein carboxylesterase notum1a [Acipenser ruthenus]